ncbi:MAG: hypothetical protein GEU86_12415 [Actinophytocola sp.]|nr:hypothetical protein [Actinophytocola sp.]
MPDSTDRVLILADALAPSYAAVLTELTPIPAVGMTVHLSDAGTRPDFDWVLVHSKTTMADANRWVTHLATATQLRVVRHPQLPPDRAHERTPV